MAKENIEPPLAILVRVEAALPRLCVGTDFIMVLLGELNNPPPIPETNIRSTSTHKGVTLVMKARPRRPMRVSERPRMVSWRGPILSTRGL